MTEGEPCHWVAPDLCSACVPAAKQEMIDTMPAMVSKLHDLDSFSIEMDGEHALMFLSTLQLALRHPHFLTPGSSPVGDMVRHVATNLQRYLSVTPELAMLCDMGWNKECDSPVPEGIAKAKVEQKRVIILPEGLG